MYYYFLHVKGLRIQTYNNYYKMETIIVNKKNTYWLMILLKMPQFFVKV